jgi:hypothetical protein
VTGTMRYSYIGSIRRIVLAVAGSAILGALAGVSPALAQAPSGVPWWRLNATSAPTYLPRHGEAQIVVTASNLGDGDVNANSEEVTLTDELPRGVRPVAVEARLAEAPSELEHQLTCGHTEVAVTCKFTGSIPPYVGLRVRITVAMEGPVETPLLNIVTVAGGDTPPPPALEEHLR